MTATKTHRYLNGGTAAALTPPSIDDQFEFDEAEVWSENEPQHEKNKQAHHHRRPARKPMRMINCDVDRLQPKSLPVNVPDWSKILGGEYIRHSGDFRHDDEYDDDEDGEEGNDRMPPHEYLAMTRGASLSVHEGVGRTLKGRDLSRVRNAIWKQIGFED